MFVLYVIASFLAPSGKLSLDLSYLCSLVHVENISSLDWSSLVLDKLCSTISSFQKKPIQKYINSCLLVLPIVYFHRFRWQGHMLPSTLPLIKHWTRKLIKDRVVEELKSGNFGDGEWVEGVYPITRNIPDVVKSKEVHIQPSSRVSEDHDENRAGPSLSVIYHLLSSEYDDDEISKLARNAQHKALLLMKRDLTIFSRVHMENWSKLMSTIEDGPDSPQLSPDTIFFQNTKLHESIDELVRQYEEQKCARTKVGRSEGVKDDIHDFKAPTFHILTPQSEEEMEACETIVTMRTGLNKDTPPSKKPCKEMNSETDLQTFFNEGVLIDLGEDSWPVPEDFLYRSAFLNENKHLLCGMSRMEKDIVDFCFVTNLSNVGCVFEYKGEVSMTFEDTRSMNDKMIFCTAIDAWALLMNKSDEVFKVRKNFSFSTQYSLYVKCLADGTDQGERIRGCLSTWLTKCGLTFSDLTNVERMFLPIWFDNHFFALVVNFVDKKVHYLNNLLTEINQHDSYYKLAMMLLKQICIFLEENEHCKAEEVKSYEVEFVLFEWNREQRNIDCAIFVMHQMENFVGAAYESSDLYELSGRKKLRAQFCSRIVLSPLNGLRMKVKNDTFNFIKNLRRYKQLKK